MTKNSPRVRHRIGAHIAAVRNGLGLRQRDVARRASITRPFLSLIENAQTDFTMTTLLAIAKAMRVPARGLFPFLLAMGVG